MIFKWLLLYIPLFLVGLIAKILSPLAVLFIETRLVRDTFKRLGYISVEIPRDRLVKWLAWFDTHDNCTDEWWYGMYNIKSFGFAQKWTQEDYDNSKVVRWFCRAMWLNRNSAYTFNYEFFGKPLEDNLKVTEWGSEDAGFWLKFTSRAKSFQLQINIPLWSGRINSVNIGWKKHKGKDKMLYAGRIVGLRSID